MVCALFYGRRSNARLVFTSAADEAVTLVSHHNPLGARAAE